MNLAIDIGNTRTKIAVFDGDRLLHREVWETLNLTALSELAYNQKVEKVILSSVANVPSELDDFLKSRFYYLQLRAGTPLPFRIKYKTPDSLGKDRIAAAAGALHLFPRKNCLVIDAGTCITSDVLNAGGEFLGGNISPGIAMRLKAMHHFTARLPLVDWQSGKEGRSLFFEERHPAAPELPFLGDSTENALRNGGLGGALWETDAFIRLCKRHFRPLWIILTGGDADFFAKNIKTKIFVHQNLVLVGLNKILLYNVEISKG